MWKAKYSYLLFSFIYLKGQQMIKKILLKKNFVYVLCLPWVLLGWRDCLCFCWFPHSHFRESVFPMCIRNLQPCLIVVIEGRCIVFLCWWIGLSAGRKQWWKREVEILSLGSPDGPFAGSNIKIAVLRSVFTILLSLAVTLQTCHPPISLPGCAPNSLMVSFTQKLGWKWTSNGDFGFFLFFTPFWPLCSLLSFLEALGGLWNFPLWQSKSGCHSFLRSSLGPLYL